MTLANRSSFELPAAVAVAAATLLSTSCGSSSQTNTVTGPSPTKCGVQVSADSSAFPPAGGNAELSALTCTPHLVGEGPVTVRSEEHTSELQSRFDLVCRLLLEKK